MNQQPINSSIHPIATEDTSHQQASHDNYGDNSRMKKPQRATEERETISSTRSEYGSSDDHSSTHTQRPVADKDAFIQPGETQQHWQHKMTPADRAKELEAEMKETYKSSEEKKLKIGGQKEFKLD